MNHHPDERGPRFIAFYLLTIREVLDRLRISRSTFYQLVKEQKIPLRKVGGASRVRSDDLEAYIKNLPALGTTEVGGDK